MALNVGTLYVSLSANSSGLAEAFENALKVIEKTAKQVKKAANDIGTAAAGFAALAAGAVAMAAKVDGPAKKALDELTKSQQLLATQVADMLLPAVQQLSEWIRQVADWVAGWDEETKKSVGTMTLWAAGIAGAGLALSKMAAIVETAVPLVKALTGVMNGMSLAALKPVLLIGLAIAAVIVALTVLHKAWRENWGDIQGVTGKVIDWIGSAFEGFFNFLAGAWRVGLIGPKLLVKAVLSVIDVLQRVSGKKLVDVDGLREGFDGLFKDLESGDFLKVAWKGTQAGIEMGKDFAGSAFETLKTEWGVMMGEFKQSELGKAIMSVGESGKAREPETPVKPGKAVATKAAEPDKAPPQKPPAWLAGAGWDAIAKAQAQLAEQEMELRQQQLDDLAQLFAAEQKAREAQAREEEEAARRQAEKEEAARKYVINKVLENTGALGSVISSIAEGFKSAGPWGALLAAITEIVTRMESFNEMTAIFEQGLKKLADFMEPVLSGLFDFLSRFTAFATDGLQPLFDAIAPIFTAIWSALEKLLPVFAAVNGIISALAPVIEWLAKVIGAVFSLLEGFFQIIGAVVRAVATVIMGVVILVNEIAAALGDVNARAEADRLKAMVDRMWNDDQVSQDASDARDRWRDQTEAQNDATASLRSLSQSLTNVPSGYKLASAIYAADMGMGGGGYDWAGGGSGGVTVNGDVNISTSGDVDAAAIEREIAARQRRVEGTRSGTTAGTERGGGASSTGRGSGGSNSRDDDLGV